MSRDEIRQWESILPRISDVVDPFHDDDVRDGRSDPERPLESASALMPARKLPSLSTRFPPMPAFTIPSSTGSETRGAASQGRRATGCSCLPSRPHRRYRVSKATMTPAASARHLYARQQKPAARRRDSRQLRSTGVIAGFGNVRPGTRRVDGKRCGRLRCAGRYKSIARSTTRHSQRDGVAKYDSVAGIVIVLRPLNVRVSLPRSDDFIVLRSAM